MMVRVVLDHLSAQDEALAARINGKSQD